LTGGIARSWRNGCDWLPTSQRDFQISFRSRMGAEKSVSGNDGHEIRAREVNAT